jgi:hypothetical protein
MSSDSPVKIYGQFYFIGSFCFFKIRDKGYNQPRDHLNTRPLLQLPLGRQQSQIQKRCVLNTKSVPFI